MGPTFAIAPRMDWLAIWQLVERMTPAQRIVWLHGCCKLASVGQHPVKVTGSKGIADEVYWDFRSIHGQGRLDYNRAGEWAERIIRGK